MGKLLKAYSDLDCDPTMLNIEGLRGGAPGGCFYFIRGESYDHDFHSNCSRYHELGFPNKILHVQGQTNPKSMLW